MRRREVITLLSGAAAWPLAAGAQKPDRVRRIGVLNGLGETDGEVQTYDAAFRNRLDELGRIDGRNIHIDYRWGAGSVERMRLFPKELVQINNAALQAETSTIPIVFSASDPIGSGFVGSLANAGENMTGNINFEASLGRKWLGLLHEVAPRVSRVAVIHAASRSHFGSGQRFADKKSSVVSGGTTGLTACTTSADVGRLFAAVLGEATFAWMASAEH
jgi:putative tryptophan/tyrosine transport system substrate-binding protein